MKQLSIARKHFIPKLFISLHRHGLYSRHRFILLFGVLAMAVGCQKLSEKKMAPLHAEFTTVSTMLQQGPPELDLIKGEGSGTPIGKSSFIANAKFDENSNLTGTITLTAENGDTFFASITGHGLDIDEKAGTITLHFHANITGGTGIFKNATGSFEGVAHDSFESANGAATWDGTISYN